MGSETTQELSESALRGNDQGISVKKLHARCGQKHTCTAVKKGSGDTVKTQFALMQNGTDLYKRQKVKRILKRGNKLMIV